MEDEFLLPSAIYILEIYQPIRIPHTRFPLVKLYGKLEFHVLILIQLDNTIIKILKIRLQIRIPHTRLPLIKLYGFLERIFTV